MITRFVNLAAIGAVALLGACTHSGEATALHWVLPEAGSKIKLNQELTAKAGSRLTVQYGRPISYKSVTWVDPFCYFSVRRPPSEITSPTSIAPDTFVITRVFRQREFSALEPAQYAYSGGEVLYAQNYNNSGSSNVFMTTVMELTSAAQPQVERLKCTRWEIPWPENFLSIDEIRGALGSVAQLELANNQDQE